MLPTTVAMTSKGAKESIVSKLGFKSSSSGSKAEAELDRVKKENAHLKKRIDEMAKRHIKPPDADKSKLLEVLFCVLHSELPAASISMFCQCFIT